MVQYKKNIPITLVCILLLSMEFGIPTYIFYLVTAALGIFVLKDGVKIKKCESIIFAFFLLVLTSYLRIFQYSERMIMNSTLTLIALLPFFNSKKIYINFRNLNYYAIIVFMIVYSNALLSLSWKSVINSFTNSDLKTESFLLSFIFPLFVLRAAITKEPTWLVLLNIIFTILSGKRIALFAVLISMSLYYVFTYKMYLWKILKGKLPYIMLGINLAFLYLSYSLSIGALGDLIGEYTGLSANAFTMGRETLYSIAFSHFNVDDISELFFGLGSISHFMNFNLHNDILKILIENGLIIFTTFWILFYRKTSVGALPVLIFLNIVFMTDNVLIYVPVLFFAFLIIRNINSISNKNYSHGRN